MGGASSQQTQEVLSRHRSNRMTELQFLSSGDHKEQCYLVRINEERLAATNRKGKITIWNYQTGSLLYQLQHVTPTISKPKISNLLVLQAQKKENPILIAAYGDVITFWDTITGNTLDQVLDKHQTQISCICPLLQPELFAFGGDKEFVLFSSPFESFKNNILL